MSPMTPQPSSSYPWEDVHPFFSGDIFYQRLGDLCNSARTSIDIDFYIFEDDTTGKCVFSHLLAASHRGVKVRIIVDGFGSVWWPWTFGPRANESGIAYRIYHQIGIERFLLGSRVIQQQIKGLWSWFQSINRRNHRKIAIFDRDKALIGSRNIASVHSESIFGEKAWRDSSVELSGAGVSILAGQFDYVWNSHRLFRRFYLKRPPSWGVGAPNGAIRHNLTRSARRRNFARLLSDISESRRRIWITNAYFVPERKILSALVAAARRGCDVQIVVPAVSDVFFVPWVASALQRDLLESGARVFEYMPTVLHAKSMIIDDSVMIGSSNMNHRSLLHDLETDIVISDRGVTERFVEQFTIDRGKSREISHSEWFHQKPWSRLLGTILLPLRRWM